jgi:hypothetical protein
MTKIIEEHHDADAYQQAREKAIAQLASGDARGAFQSFRPILAYPAPLLTEPRWREALDLFARISEGIVGSEWAKHVRNAARQVNDIESLYTLGFQLIEQSLHAIAATVLARADRLAPGQEPILSELVVALECLGNNSEARRLHPHKRI